MKQLTESDSEFCNQVWAYSDANSKLFVQSLINTHGGIALCDKVSGRILSFGIVNDHLAIGILNTVEQARGKGLAEFIVKHLSHEIAENLNLHPTCFINKKNVTSMKLFKKIGFSEISDCDWIWVAPE